MTRFLLSAITAIFLINTSIASEFEPSTIVMSASDILETGVLKGKHHTIDNTVTIDGYMNHFTINSEFGQFTAIGNLELNKLLYELDAIAELKARTTTDTSTDAVIGTVADTGKSLSNVVNNPAGTAQGVSGGVSRFFKRTKRSAENLADKTKDSINDDETDEAAEKDSGAESDVADTSQQVAEAYLGVGKAQRKLAQELGVDPYTRNKVLQEELHRVAQISGTVGKVTKLLMPMPAFVGAATSVSNLVWSLSPTDLLIQNEEKLEAMGYKKKQVKKFFANPVFTPTEQTLLVTTLESLNKVQGRELFLDMAISAQSQTEGGFIVQSALFTELYHDNIGPVAKLLRVPDGALPLAITKNSDAVLFAPLDYLMWTEDVAEANGRLNGLTQDVGITGEKQLWVEGRISAMASSGLTAAGWKETQGGFKKLKAMIENGQ